MFSFLCGANHLVLGGVCALGCLVGAVVAYCITSRLIEGSCTADFTSVVLRTLVFLLLLIVCDFPWWTLSICDFADVSTYTVGPSNLYYVIDHITVIAYNLPLAYQVYFEVL